MKMIQLVVAVLFVTLMVVGFAIGLGQKVEVPPAHVGKIMTKDGYQEGLIPTSKFRLDWCFTWCNRLVLLDVSDQSFQEPLEIFIPKDKLNLTVQVRATLSVNPKKTTELFNSVSPSEVADTDYLSFIDHNRVYTTYAQQIILAETREYLSQFSISEVASSLEKVNSDLGERLSNALSERTPFTVRYVGLTNINYPKIITDAQENAAERREQIQQEEAQLQISKVKLERQLQETRLARQIEKEKADTNAEGKLIVAKAEAKAIELKGQAEADALSLKAKALANNSTLVDLTWAQTWKGEFPTTMLQSALPTFAVPTGK